LLTLSLPLGSNKLEAAVAFWKALKVYPQPADLIGIYDKVRYRVHSLEAFHCNMREEPRLTIAQYRPFPRKPSKFSPSLSLWTVLPLAQVRMLLKTLWSKISSCSSPLNNLYFRRPMEFSMLYFIIYVLESTHVALSTDR
jgi:hypothetical protein